MENQQQQLSPEQAFVNSYVQKLSTKVTELVNVVTRLEVQLEMMDAALKEKDAEIEKLKNSQPTPKAEAKASPKSDF